MTPPTDEARDVLEERLRYHIGDLLPADADWRDFAAKLIRELKDDGFVVERPYLLGKVKP